MENGKLITIQFHMDDLKLLHVDGEVLKKYVKMLNDRFRTKFQELSVNRSDIHDYLGLCSDYTHRKECYVKLTMYNFFKDILEEIKEKGNMNGECVTPAAVNLFTVVETSEKLSVNKADYFHRLVTRLLFASKRARPDIQVAVAYLCTRAICPNEANYDKLHQVIKYIRITIHTTLLLGWNKSDTIKWSVDASFDVHSDSWKRIDHLTMNEAKDQYKEFD